MNYLQIFSRVFNRSVNQVDLLCTLLNHDLSRYVALEKKMYTRVFFCPGDMETVEYVENL